MDAPVEQHGTLPSSVPTGIVGLLAAAAVAAWVATHVFISPRKSRRARLLLFFVRVLVGCTALWLALNALGRTVMFLNAWSLWIPSLIGAAAVEISLALYALERRTVSRGAGFVLAVLRMALVLLVVIMLVQPVFSWEETRLAVRYVVVLLDDSASMHLVDRQLSVSEKLQLVQVFRPGAPDRPHRLDQCVGPLEEVRDKLAAQADSLALLKDAAFDMLKRQLETRRESMQKLFAHARRTVDAQAKTLSNVQQAKIKLDVRTRAAMKEARDKLEQRVRGLVAAGAKIVDGRDSDALARRHRHLLETVRHAQDALRDVLGRLPGLAAAVDEAYFASLPVARQMEINTEVVRTRQAIARAVLLTEGDDAPPLIHALGRKYLVKFYKFAGRPTELKIGQWQGGAEPPQETGDDPSGQPEATQSTDLAAALEKALVDVPAGKLAGVLILSDGRHNTKSAIEPAARRLGAQKAPACSVLIGSTRPPVDGAITGVVAPQAIYAEDQLVVEVGLRFDGLRGRKARVRLVYEGKTVSERTVRVAGDHFRTIVNLTDTPKDKGLRAYKVELEQFDDEAFMANNTRTVNIAVTEERTKLLIVGGRPRWEIRYLRNLFAGRDKSVQLQYVLLHPDRIGDVKPPKVHASASRASEQVEASALPENEGEWLKFDVIVLGDVSPDAIGKEEARILEKFVAERAGTLVVIAGPRYMPHAFADSVLREMLPVRFEPSQEAILSSPEPSFRIALSEAGRDHVVMQQSDMPHENLLVWQSRPEIYWRHPIKDTPPGATVLAFAMPRDLPDVFRPRNTKTVREAEELARARRGFERKNALIAVQQFALGRVMMLNFDRTWRLRYRVGDTYHHKFWGQVLRWATPGKLPAGTDRVRLGTDRMLYAPDELVRVRARLTREDHAPVVGDDVRVNVYDGTQLVLQRKLDYVPNSAGIYEATLDALSAGRQYRIELGGDEVAKLLTGEAVKRVETQIMVTERRSAELLELSADRSVLDRLARLSGGVVAEPREAGGLPERFGSGTEEITERRPYLIWNSWPLLIIMVLIVTVEWVFRKKVGLT